MPEQSRHPAILTRPPFKLGPGRSRKPPPDRSQLRPGPEVPRRIESPGWAIMQGWSTAQRSVLQPRGTDCGHSRRRIRRPGSRCSKSRSRPVEPRVQKMVNCDTDNPGWFRSNRPSHKGWPETGVGTFAGTACSEVVTSAISRIRRSATT
jgi:hypothetical protein